MAVAIGPENNGQIKLVRQNSNNSVSDGGMLTLSPQYLLEPQQSVEYKDHRTRSSTDVATTATVRGNTSGGISDISSSATSICNRSFEMKAIVKYLTLEELLHQKRDQGGIDRVTGEGVR